MQPFDVIAADGTRLSAHRWPGADPAFVLVHGLASNARVWDGVAGRLSDAGHAVVSYDQRGHGRSDRPGDGYDIATAVDDLQRVIAAAGVRRPVLAGQSWGGNLVVGFAARTGEELAAVAGIDGGMIDLPDHFATWEDCAAALTPPRHRSTLEEVAGWMRAAHPDWPADGIAATLANLEEGSDGIARNRLPTDAHMQLVRAMWDHPPGADLAVLPVPALFVLAEEDGPRGAAARETAARHSRPGLRVAWMRGDHDLHVQHPGPIARHLLSLA